MYVLLLFLKNHRIYLPLGHVTEFCPVIELYPGKDGKVHSVKQQVADKQLMRSVVKLRPL